LICYLCHDSVRHGILTDFIYLCSRCCPALVRRFKNPTGKYSYVCTFQEWLSNDSCHEHLVKDKAHNSNGKHYADSLVCPKGHTRIIIGY